jgi:sialic acid synthase SpsE
MRFTPDSIFLVSEIGVNWNGDFSIAEQMISKSKECGFNAVKFQSFNEKIIGNHPQKNKLLATSISPANIDQIDDLAKQYGIEWFSTPMYPEAVDFLKPYVKRFKVRESDGKKILKNEKCPIFQKILDTDLNVIISSNSLPTNCKYYKNEKIKWLYCVPEYPCSYEKLDFHNIQNFNGYSNHTPGIIAPFTAAILGSKILEIHVTNDKMGNYFDNNVSLDFSESKMLIDSIKQFEKISI